MANTFQIIGYCLIAACGYFLAYCGILMCIMCFGFPELKKMKNWVRRSILSIITALFGLGLLAFSIWEIIIKITA